MHIGIDPGKGGGIATLAAGIAHATKMPETERDIWDFFREHAIIPCRAVIERVHAMPKQGVSSTFTFGQGYGFLRCCLIGNHIPFEAVAPGVWQRKMGCLSRGDKNVTKARAQELFPEERITHAVADALLLAEYCRRTRVMAASS